MVDAYKVTHPGRLHSVPSLTNTSQPDYIAPIVGYLTSQDNTETTARLFEISGGWAAETRWQRTGGHGFPTNVTLTLEDILAKWDVFTNFGACLSVCRALGWPLTSSGNVDDGRATHPATSTEAMATFMANLDNTTADVKSKL